MEGRRIHIAGTQQFAVDADPTWKGFYEAKLMRGGTPAKKQAGALSINTFDPDKPRVQDVLVQPHHRRKGLASSLMARAVEDYPNLSHSTSLSTEGALNAMANPLPGDGPEVKSAIGRATKPIWSAANSMLGGPTDGR